MEPRRLLANIVVNTLADETVANSTTSLREAVAKAGSNFITFQPGLAGTITLNAPIDIVDKFVTINGPGAGTIAVSGNNAHRVFNLSTSIGTGIGVVISGLTIKQGLADRGGGIFISGPVQLQLTNVTMSGNVARGASGDFGDGDDPDGGDGFGGAIYGGAVTLSGGAMTDNLAVGGDGGFVDSPDLDNRYGDGGDGFGGAIYGGATIEGTTFTNNIARGGAGLSFTQGGAGGNAYGGAIVTRGRMFVTGATFTGNKALGGDAGEGDFDSSFGGGAEGGAIWSDASESTLAIGTSTFTNNQATGGAGGHVIESFFHYECGNASGGAISNARSSAATSIGSSTLSTNSATGCIGGGGAGGGAISIGGGQLTVINSTLANNKAVGSESLVNNQRGGGASGGAIVGSGLFDITGSTLVGTSAIGGKGANADATRGREVPAADGGSAFGGGIYAGGFTIEGQVTPVSISRSTIVNNTAQGGQGGQGYDNSIWHAGNGGAARGGGVYLPNVGSLIADTIAGNAVVAGIKGEVAGEPSTANNGVRAGGGVAVVGTNTVTIANCIIATNSPPGDVSGVVKSQGYNLIGKTNGSQGWLASDKKGTATTPLDPKLGGLAKNGGPTQTMLPLTGSPVIDAGKAFGVTFDQRGLPRPADLAAANASGGDGSDIGAVEVQPAVPIQFPFTDVNLGDYLTFIGPADFDNGGEGVAYHDLDAVNRGGRYRETGVDIDKAWENGDGNVVGWTKAGEWLEYTVNVEVAGAYNFDFFMKSNGPGGKFHLEVDGVNKTGSLTVPDTGGWYSNPLEVSKSGVQLTAGTHVLRLAMESNGATGSVGNFFSIGVAKTTVPVPINTDTAAHVRDGTSANTNFGNAGSLEVKKSTPGYNREAYLKFNLGSVSSVGTAKLRIFGSLDVAGSISLGVYGSSNTGWSETGLTWNNRNPGVTGTSAVSAVTVSGTTGQWYELDVTAYVKAEKLAGRNTVTLVLKSGTTTSALAKFGADGSANPLQLVVTG
jgi:CSLREA domain-containing protein